MNQNSKRFETVFKCDLEAISDTVNLFIAYVENNSNDIDLGIITRIKWVITEMLTNAIKHAGVEECTLTVLISDKQLLFEKTDDGNALALNEHTSSRKILWPLKNESLPKRFQVYHNGSESLSALVEDPNRAIFFVQEMGEQLMPGLLLDTSEHFGLLILTKASDHFEYEYEPVSGTNLFRSTFNLQNS